jgi:transposase
MYSFFVGIDVGKWNHQAAFMDLSGSKAAPELAFSNTSEGFQSLLNSLASFDKEQTVIGLEATGHYWMNLFSFLVDELWTVKVINPMQSDALRNINIRKTKTDRKDSVLIADVLRFGRYTETVLPEEELLQLRELSRCRTGLVESVGNLKRKILGILDRIFPEFASCFSTVFGSAPTELLQEYADPETLANCDVEKLVKLLEKESRGRHSDKKAQELKDKAARSIGIRMGVDALKFEIRLLLQQLEFIRKQIREIDKFLKKLMKKYEVILSIPGISFVLGAAIIGEVGDIGRFATPRQLQAFAGMDPSVTQSGNFSAPTGKMSKRGSPYLRRAVYLAANAARRYDSVFKEHYDRLAARGKHPKQALGAVATKLLRVIHAVLKTQKPYDPQKLAFSSSKTSV